MFDIGLQNTVVDRWNFILRALFDFVPLIGTVFLWKALFASRQQPVGGYDFASMVCYFLLTMLASNLVTPTEDEWQIAADIREGQINSLLVKPINYLGYRFSLFLGYRVIFTVVTLPLVFIIFAYYHAYLTLPEHFSTWIISGFSLGLAALLQFFLAYAVALLAFWLLEISTVVFIIFSFEYFLSGHLFPLDLMPGWLRGALDWLPFTYELYFPVVVFQEKVRGDMLVKGLLIQASWVLIAWLVGHMMWVRGLRRYQAVGG